MRDLAAALHIKAASLYSHFSSKDELLEIICEGVYLRMKGIVEEISDENLTKEQKFNLYIRRHIESMYYDEEASKIYYKYWQIADQSNVKIGKLNEEYFEMVKKIAAEMFPNEEDKSCYIPDSTAVFLLEMLSGITKLINPENPDLDMVVEDVQYRLIYGFKKDL